MTSSTTFTRTLNHRHRYFSGEHEHEPPLPSTNLSFDFTEFDVWNVSPSPELQKTVTPATINRREITGATTAPVDVPDWSMILKEELTENCTADGDGDDEYDGELIPPHEYVRGRIKSCSVHEGYGRTLKGRDLRRVRNAVWKKIGFED